MKNGWLTKKLGELCEIELGKTPARGNSAFWDEKRETSNVWLSIADLLNAEDNVVLDSKEYISDKGAAISKIVPKGTLLVSFKLTLGRLAFAGRNLYTNEAIAALTIFNERDLLKEFLFYFLHFFDWVKAAENDVKLKGMTLNKAKLKLLEVHFPKSLTEQKRIVAILDEAFEGISAAVANAEKNLANARELFDSYLNSVFTQKGKGWAEKPIAQIATKIGSGATPRGGQESYKSEGVPLIRSMNVHDRKFKYDDLAFLGDEQAEKLDNVIVQNGDVLLNITGASVARCCQVPDDVLPARVNQHVSIIRPIQSIVSPQFLEYALTARPNKDRLLGVGEKGGSTRQAITKAEIQEFQLAYPPFDAQAAMTSRLDELSIETSRLENIYQQKLDALAELKQSILQKAFAGELTSSMALPNVVAAKKAAEIESVLPEFSANVLAFAHYQHALQKKDKTFGRVKAQKILQLTESIGGIELGRKPMKDAAGPNDFHHMLKAEDWAKSNRFFEFVSRDGGYDFKKLPRYDEMLARAIASVKPYQDKLKKVVDLVLPMNSRDAEVFATVHAAWNNLILDKQPVTDEAIIREARENWHSEKLRIPEDDFRKAIRLIRNKGLVPDGSAKRVGGQDTLL